MALISVCYGSVCHGSYISLPWVCLSWLLYQSAMGLSVMALILVCHGVYISLSDCHGSYISLSWFLYQFVWRDDTRTVTDWYRGHDGWFIDTRVFFKTSKNIEVQKKVARIFLMCSKTFFVSCLNLTKKVICNL